MSQPLPDASPVVRLLREPTLLFAVLAAGLFAVSWLSGARKGNVITIDRGAVTLRIAEIESARASLLTPQERREVEEGFIEEQVLVREARKLGLQQDARIEDILVQKMLHVLSGDVVQPSDEELQAYYRANLERYGAEPSLTLDELVIGTDDPLPESLIEQLRRGVPPGDVATDLPLRSSTLVQVSRNDLASVFGAATATLIYSAEPGTWVGPHVTFRGQHWYRARARTEDPDLPPLDSIRERVRLDWVGDQELARLQERVAELRTRYTIEFVGAEGP